MQHILVVDDDALMLSLMAKALSEYRVSVARHPSEALQIVDKRLNLDLLITDYLMPEMTGDELLGRIRERRPALKALLVSGHGATLEQEVPDWWHSEPHLAKPFTLAALRDAVVSLIGLPQQP
jgi:CheY-like chemotaxis protein